MNPAIDRALSTLNVKDIGRDICLLLDISGSMSTIETNGKKRCEELAEQLPVCIFGKLKKTDFIKIVVFAKTMQTVLEYTMVKDLNPSDIDKLDVKNLCNFLNDFDRGQTRLWKSIEDCIDHQKALTRPKRPFLFLTFTDGQDSTGGTSDRLLELLQDTTTGLKFHLYALSSTTDPQIGKLPKPIVNVEPIIDIDPVFAKLVTVDEIPCKLCKESVYNGPNKCIFLKAEVHLTCAKCTLCHTQLGSNFLKEHDSGHGYFLLCSNSNREHLDEKNRLDDLRLKWKPRK